MVRRRAGAKSVIGSAINVLNVVTINWHNYCGRGVEYVETLFDMVRRNLPAGFPGKFTVFTDDVSQKYELGIEVKELPKGLVGYWNKLYLFAPEAFSQGERVLYFDLDTAITGPLDAIVRYAGP